MNVPFASLALLACAALLAATPAAAQPMPTSSVPPTTSQALMGSIVATAGVVPGAFLGSAVGYALSPPPDDCDYFMCGLGGSFTGAAVGAVAGVLAGGTLAKHVMGRGSATGATVGVMGGAAVGAILLSGRDRYGEAVPVLIPTVAAAVVGGAIGFRFGPGAQGPGQAPRVTVTPVATPDGQGVYAVVRF
ncbi:MAG: hypothetical protein LCH53_01675 [Bacteroidetes bacterium]|nr:hypothetical protein [Bacteroidota bacterium]